MKGPEDERCLSRRGWMRIPSRQAREHGRAGARRPWNAGMPSPRARVTVASLEAADKSKRPSCGSTARVTGGPGPSSTYAGGRRSVLCSAKFSAQKRKKKKKQTKERTARGNRRSRPSAIIAPVPPRARRRPFPKRSRPRPHKLKCACTQEPWGRKGWSGPTLPAAPRLENKPARPAKNRAPPARLKACGRLASYPAGSPPRDRPRISGGGVPAGRTSEDARPYFPLRSNDPWPSSVTVEKNEKKNPFCLHPHQFGRRNGRRSTQRARSRPAPLK